MAPNPTGPPLPPNAPGVIRTGGPETTIVDPSGLYILDPSKPAIPLGAMGIPLVEPGAGEAAPPAAPGAFRGLAHYSFGDAPVFFGRSVEAETLTRLLLGPDCRAVVLIGERGVGKSSFLRAGIGAAARTEGAIVVLVSEYVGATERIVRDVEAASGVSHASTEPAADYLVRVAKSRALLVLCDDAQRIFSEVTPGQDRYRLLQTARALSSSSEVPPPRVGILFAIDEDHRYFAESFGNDVPETRRAERRFRLSRFDAATARTVIEKCMASVGAAAGDGFAAALAADLTREGPVLPAYLQLAGASAVRAGVTRAPDLVARGGGRTLLFEFLSQTVDATPHPECARDVLIALVDAEARPLDATFEDLLDRPVGTGAELTASIKALEAAGVVRSFEAGGRRRYTLRHPALAPLVVRSLGRAAEADWRGRAIWTGRLATGKRLSPKDLDELDRRGIRAKGPAEAQLLRRSQAALSRGRVLRWIAVSVAALAALAYVGLSGHVRTERYGDREELVAGRGPWWWPHALPEAVSALLPGGAIERLGFSAAAVGGPEGAEGRGLPGFAVIGGDPVGAAARRGLRAALPPGAAALVAHHLRAEPGESAEALAPLLGALETEAARIGVLHALGGGAISPATDEAWTAVIEDGLGNEKKGVKRAAAAAIAAASGESAVLLAEKALGSDDAGVRRAAIDAVAKLGGVSGRLSLVQKGLADKDPVIRAAAARAAIGSSDAQAASAMNALAKLIGDDAPEVRAAVLGAAAALVPRAGKDALPMITAPLAPGPGAPVEEMRVGLLRILAGPAGALDWNAAVSAAWGRAADKKEVLAVRIAALGVLEAAAIARGEAALPVEDAAAAPASGGAGAAVGAGPGAVAPAGAGAAGAAATAAAGLAIGHLDTLARDDGPLRVAALQAIARACEKAPARYGAVLEGALAAGSEGVREAGLEGVGLAARAAPAEAADALAGLIGDAIHDHKTDESFKAAAARALGALPDRPRALGLLSDLLGDDVASVRLAAIDAYGDTPAKLDTKPGAVGNELLRVVRDPAGEAERAAALRTLLALDARGAAFTPAAVAAAKAGGPEARAVAAVLLGRGEGKAARDALVRLAADDGVPAVRAAALTALPSLPAPDAAAAAAAVDLAVRLAADGAPDVRVAAAGALGALGSAAGGAPARKAFDACVAVAGPPGDEARARATGALAAVATAKDAAPELRASALELARARLGEGGAVGAAAAGALKTLGDTSATTMAALAGAAPAEPSGAARSAMEALALAAPEDGAHALAAVVRTAVGAGERRSAMMVLAGVAAGTLPGEAAAVKAAAAKALPIALDALGAAATDPAPGVRVAAVEALALVPGEAADAALLDRLRDDSGLVAAAAVDAFAARASARAPDAWLGDLAAPEPPVRLAAMVALERAAHADAKEAVSLRKALDELRAVEAASPAARLAAALLADALAADPALALAYWRALYGGAFERL